MIGHCELLYLLIILGVLVVNSRQLSSDGEWEMGFREEYVYISLALTDIVYESEDYWMSSVFAGLAAVNGPMPSVYINYYCCQCLCNTEREREREEEYTVAAYIISLNIHGRFAFADALTLRHR